MALTSKEIIREPVAVALSGVPDDSPLTTVSEGPRLPLGRGSHAGGTIDGHIVVVGGTSWNADGTKKTFLNDGVVFAHNSWRPGPSIDVGLAEGAFADDGHQMYLAGGLQAPDQPTNKVFRIRLDASGAAQVASLPSLPRARSACGAALLGTRLFVACGTFSPGKSTKELVSLDTSSAHAHWQKCAPLPGVGRGYPALVACGGSIYLLGGLSDGTGSVHERSLSDVYQYDATLDRWKSLGNLPMAGYCWSAEPIDDTRILIAGRADGSIHNEIWVIRFPDLKSQLIGHTVIQATCAPLVKAGFRTWWLIGGEPDSNKHRTDRVTVISLR